MKYIISILIFGCSFFSIFPKSLATTSSMDTNNPSSDTSNSLNFINYSDIATTFFFSKNRHTRIFYMNPEILNFSLPDILDSNNEIVTPISSETRIRLINILKIFHIFLDLAHQNLDESQISTVFPKQFNYIKQNYMPSEIREAIHYYLTKILYNDLYNNIDLLLPLIINFELYYDWNNFIDSILSQKKEKLSISFSIYFSFIKLILLHKEKAIQLLENELIRTSQILNTLSRSEIQEIRYLIRKIIEKAQPSQPSTNNQDLKDKYFDILQRIDTLLSKKTPDKKSIFQLCYEFFTKHI